MTVRAQSAGKTRGRGLLAVGLGVLVLAVVLIVWGSQRTVEARFQGQVAELLPPAPSGWTAQDLPIADTPEMQRKVGELLNFDDGVFRVYRGGGARFSVYLAYWRPGRMAPRLVAGHTPDVCWVGAGWKVAAAKHADARTSIFSAESTDVARQRGDGQRAEGVKRWPEATAEGDSQRVPAGRESHKDGERDFNTESAENAENRGRRTGDGEQRTENGGQGTAEGDSQRVPAKRVGHNDGERNFNAESTENAENRGRGTVDGRRGREEERENAREGLLPAEERVMVREGVTEYVQFWHLSGEESLSYGRLGNPPWWAAIGDLLQRGLDQRKEQWFIRISSDQPIERWGQYEVYRQLLERLPVRSRG